MKTNLVIARPGKEIRLSKIDPDDTGGWDKDEAVARTAKIYEKLLRWQEILYAEHKQSLLLVFQAMDTGGKDGAVKSLCAGLNPAGVEITSFKTPTSVESDHDFLWRHHHAAPGKGMIGIWNRSHYESVLVVRVHKLAEKKVWKAHYDEINRFEKLLTDNGTTILKFMLHISKEEQEERLQARLDDPEKLWKFNPGDLKERELWDDYQEAYQDAINRCTTDYAPWHIVPANHKWARNLAIADRVLSVLKDLDPSFPKPSFDPKTITIK